MALYMLFYFVIFFKILKLPRFRWSYKQSTMYLKKKEEESITDTCNCFKKSNLYMYNLPKWILRSVIGTCIWISSGALDCIISFWNNVYESSSLFLNPLYRSTILFLEKLSPFHLVIRFLIPMKIVIKLKTMPMILDFQCFF